MILINNNTLFDGFLVFLLTFLIFCYIKIFYYNKFKEKKLIRLYNECFPPQYIKHLFLYQ